MPVCEDVVNVNLTACGILRNRSVKMNCLDPASAAPRGWHLVHARSTRFPLSREAAREGRSPWPLQARAAFPVHSCGWACRGKSFLLPNKKPYLGSPPSFALSLGPLVLPYTFREVLPGVPSSLWAKDT